MRHFGTKLGIVDQSVLEELLHLPGRLAGRVSCKFGPKQVAGCVLGDRVQSAFSFLAISQWNGTHCKMTRLPSPVSCFRDHHVGTDAQWRRQCNWAFSKGGESGLRISEHRYWVIGVDWVVHWDCKCRTFGKAAISARKLEQRRPVARRNSWCLRPFIRRICIHYTMQQKRRKRICS